MLNNPPTPPDEDIMDALKKGERQALGLLYDKYAPAILGLLQKITGNTHLAEEALQVCFMKIWQNKHQYNFTKERPFVWMLSIVRQVAGDIPGEKIKALKIQNSALSVCEVDKGDIENEHTKSIMVMLLLGNMPEKEAAQKAGIPIAELREMIRKEINQLRGITVE